MPSQSTRMLLLVLLLALSWLPPWFAVAAKPHPDIIVVVTDDMRSSDWQALPQTQALLADGTWLPNFILTTALCCPSRTTMLSGKYAHNTGVYDNDAQGRPGGWRAFRNDESTALPTHLPDYDTALIGKYLNEYDGHTAVPGWDVFFPTHSGRATYHLKDGYSTDVERDHALAFLTDGDSDPKFLWFAPFAPHEPATYAPRHADAFPEASGKDRDRLRSLLAVDEAVAALYAAAPPDTVWIVVSDNGFLIGEHGITGKNAPYDAVHRVAALVRIPGLPGGSDDRITANVDLFATVLTAAGYDVPTNDGHAWQDGGWQRDGILLESWWIPPRRNRQKHARTGAPLKGVPYAYAGIWTPQFTYLERTKKGKHLPPVLWDRANEGVNVLGAQVSSQSATDWATWLDQLRDCAGADCG